MSEKDTIEVTDGWIVERYEFTGHGKLIARLVSRHTGNEINIVPYKNYGIGGLPNCHRITLTKDNSIEVIAEGLEVEHADEAKEVAIETMQQLSEDLERD